MRKVYQNKSNFAGLPVAVGIAACLTAIIFCIIPFSHIINKPPRNIEFRKTSAVDLAPKVEEEAPQLPEPEKPEEKTPEPQLTETTPQQVPLSADLDIALGTGGALKGWGDVRTLTAPEKIKDETFDVSELEKKPEAVSQVAPAYPKELAKAKIEGSVTLVFVLSEDGRVEDARVENSSRPEFEKPSLDAIRKWRFRPGMKDGQAVRTYVRIPMRFRVPSG
ncbi:MAG TPA: energy transducer TonB [Verrucomicrobiae bacterium]|nr:energy transducer TonB [Verrucomicrobiae bacterium]